MREGAESVFHLYVVQIEDRDSLLIHLKKSGVHAGVHYPVPVHLQPAYKDRVLLASTMSKTEMLSQRIISLPIYPELSIIDVKKIVNSIKSFFAGDEYEN